MKVTVLTAVGDPAPGGANGVVHIEDVNQPAHGASGSQAQREHGDYAEEAVTAGDEAEKLRQLVAGALGELAVGHDQRDGDDIVHEGPHQQPAAVGVGGKSAAEGQLIGPGLFLTDGPYPRRIFLGAKKGIDHARPDRAGL